MVVSIQVRTGLRLCKITTIEFLHFKFSLQHLSICTVDSLEFHWRTLVPFALELYCSSAGVPLENLSSTGAPGDAPGHGQAVPQPGACPGQQTHGCENVWKVN